MATSSFAFVALLAVLPLIATFSAMGLTVVLIVWTLLAGFASRWRWTGDLPVATIIAIVTAWALVSTAWSITPSNSALAAVKFGAIMLIGFAALRLAQAPLPQKAIILCAAVMAFCAALLVVEKNAGVLQFVYNALHIDYARFIDKNVNRGLCALTVLAWPIAGGLWNAGRRGMAGGLMALIVIAVLRFDSASAMLALGASVIVLGLIMLAPKAIPKVLYIAIPAFFLAWPWIFGALDEPFFSTPQVYNALPSTAQHRVEIWRFVLTKWAEAPWLGWGFESARAIPGGDVMYGQGRTYLPLHPHNSALQILLELGMIGLLIWTIALAALLRRWSNIAVLPLHRATAGAAIVAYICIGFTAFGAWQTWWIAAGWITAVLWRAISADPPPQPV